MGGSETEVNQDLESTEPNRSQEYLEVYFDSAEELIGILLESIRAIEDHFDEDGKRRGEGQWRDRRSLSDEA